MSTSKTRGRIGYLVAAAVVALLLAAGWASIFGGPYTKTVPQFFNSAGWKRADVASNTRCGMVGDLMGRVGVVGRSRVELIGLLGKPEDHGNDPAVSHWHLCPSFMDVYILEVRWSGDRAVSASVRDT